jgi:hypothetical protein
MPDEPGLPATEPPEPAPMANPLKAVPPEVDIVKRSRDIEGTDYVRFALDDTTVATRQPQQT